VAVTTTKTGVGVATVATESFLANLANPAAKANMIQIKQTKTRKLPNSRRSFAFRFSLLIVFVSSALYV